MSLTALPFRSVLAAKRLKDLAALFLKYGLGELVSVLGFKPGRGRLFCPKESCALHEHLSIWERIRIIMEDMGPTTIKIGQLLSMRPDLVPTELCDALRDLQENVYQEKYEHIVAAVEGSLKKPLTEVFRSFEKTPVAAASLSQVHKAVLKDGRVVAVKVRRPKIMETVLADLEIMRFIATRLHERVSALRSANAPDVVAETRKSIMRELDFRNEARNIILFNNLFADDPHIMAPKVIPELTTDQILVMEFVDGVRIDQFDGDEDTRKMLAEKGLDAAVEQMLVHGFFHADPHMGNLKLVNGDTLCYMDWGMVGRFTPSQRSGLVDYVLAIVDNNAAKVSDVALGMAAKTPPLLDRERFQTDVMFILESVRAPLHGNVNLGRFLLDLTALCRTYDITLRSDYILMARALIATEAAGRALYPPFDAIASLKPVAMRWVVKRYSVIFSDRPVLGPLQDNLEKLATLPTRLDTVLSVIESGELSVRFKQEEQADMIHNLRKIGNRLAASLIAASLVIGSAQLYVSDIGPHWGSVPIFGLTGFVLSGLFSAWLVMHMMLGD